MNQLHLKLLTIAIRPALFSLAFGAAGEYLIWWYPPLAMLLVFAICLMLEMYADWYKRDAEMMLRIRDMQDALEGQEDL
jgi:hypothetical protein